MTARLNILLHWEGGEHTGRPVGSAHFRMRNFFLHPGADRGETRRSRHLGGRGPVYLSKIGKNVAEQTTFPSIIPIPLPPEAAVFQNPTQAERRAGKRDLVVDRDWRGNRRIAFGYFLWIRVSAFDRKRFVPIPRQGAIILGASLEGHRPSPALKERLAQALELYERDLAPHPDPVRRFSPGKHSRSSRDDGICGERGMQKQDLILEDRSTNTAENLIHSRKVLFSHDIQDVYLVTHDFHMYERSVAPAGRSSLSPRPLLPADPSGCLIIRPGSAWHSSKIIL